MMLIWSHSRGETWTRIVLSNRILVMIGIVSYSLYLWHWPVHVYVRIGAGHLNQRTLLFIELIIILLISSISYLCIERPFRRSAKLKGKLLFATILVMTASLAVPASWIFFTNGAKYRYSKVQQTIFDIADAGKKYGGLDQIPSRIADLQRLGSSGSPPVFAVWGDSHATGIASLFDQLAKTNGVSGVLAARGGVPSAIGIYRSDLSEADNQWNAKFTAAMADMLAASDIKHVFLVSAWDTYINEHGLFGAENTPIELSKKGGEEALFAGLRHSVDELHAKQKMVYCLLQAPRQSSILIRRHQASLFKSIGTVSLASKSKDEHLRETRGFRSLVSSVESTLFKTIDPAPFCFDENGMSKIEGNGLPLYNDQNHLSLAA